jgi:hypothetical protein
MQNRSFGSAEFPMPGTRESGCAIVGGYMQQWPAGRLLSPTPCSGACQPRKERQVSEGDLLVPKTQDCFSTFSAGDAS